MEVEVENRKDEILNRKVLRDVLVITVENRGKGIFGEEERLYRDRKLWIEFKMEGTLQKR